MAAAKKNSKKTTKKVGKKLTRSQDRMFLGVCGGIGEYIKVDPTLIRLAWIVITVFTGFFLGLIAYIIHAQFRMDFAGRNHFLWFACAMVVAINQMLVRNSIANTGLPAKDDQRKMI